MYKTDFIVRYHDIECELVNNLYKMAQRKKEKEMAIILANAKAAVIQKENQIKNLKEIEQKQMDEIATKKKGGRKKASQQEDTQSLESVKKRGRKKVVKEEPEPESQKEKIDTTELEPEKNKNDSDEEEIEYTMEDVHLICDKLYRDELLSVFGVDSLEDPNIDTGIKAAIEQMIDNKNFKQLLEEIKHELIDYSNFSGTPTEIENIKRNSEYLIFITLFSQSAFYLTHKCICQLFTVGEIDQALINRLKEKMISLFKK
jgi:hypothetical protein